MSIVANREASKVQGAYAGEELTEYTNAKNEKVITFKRTYADGEHTVFMYNGKVVLIKKTEEIEDEAAFINTNKNLLFK